MGLFGKLWNKGRQQAAGQAPTPPPAKPLKVSNYLSEKTICFLPTGISKQDALTRLINLIELSNPAAAIKAVLDREAAGPTVIAPGIAVPHARVEGLTGLVAAMGVCPTGVADPSAEGGLVRLFVLFVGPAGNMKEHLGFLASVASLFQIEGFGDVLLQQTAPPGVLDKIRDAEKTL